MRGKEVAPVWRLDCFFKGITAVKAHVCNLHGKKGLSAHGHFYHTHLWSVGHGCCLAGKTRSQIPRQEDAQPPGERPFRMVESVTATSYLAPLLLRLSNHALPTTCWPLSNWERTADRGVPRAQSCTALTAHSGRPLTLAATRSDCQARGAEREGSEEGTAGADGAERRRGPGDSSSSGCGPGGAPQQRARQPRPWPRGAVQWPDPGAPCPTPFMYASKRCLIPPAAACSDRPHWRSNLSALGFLLGPVHGVICHTTDVEKGDSCVNKYSACSE